MSEIPPVYTLKGAHYGRDGCLCEVCKAMTERVYAALLSKYRLDTKKTRVYPAWFLALAKSRGETNLSNDPLFESEYMAVNLSEHLYRAMEKAGLNENKLAERLGVSRQEVNEVMAGNRNLTLRTIAKYCIALGVRAEITLKARNEQ